MPSEPFNPSSTNTSVGQLLRKHGEASAAMLLLLVGLLCLTPLLGVSLLVLLIAWRWHRPDLGVVIPDRLAAWQLGQRWSQRIEGLLGTTQLWSRRWLRGRWTVLLAPATHLAWGAWIGLMGLLILLPLPLANLLPALSLVLLSLAWMARDGLALAAALLTGAAGLVYTVVMSHLLLVLAHEGLMWLRTALV
jgi:hypothetical protein